MQKFYAQLIASMMFTWNENIGVIHIGIRHIKRLPRIPVTELEQNTKEFTKYVYVKDNFTILKII